MIKGLNLALSNHCTGKCVFCPTDRGKSDPHNMRLFLVEKLLDEVTSPDFPWKIATVQLGENGDALLNPDFAQIVSLIHERLPAARLNLTTNLANMDHAVMKRVLQGRMLASVGINIDGHDAETYEEQKGLDYRVVMANFADLLDMRAKYCPNMAVSVTVLTLQRYCAKVIQRFGRPATKAPEHFIASTFDEVRDSLTKQPWWRDDIAIRNSPVFFWAERQMPITFDLSEYQCPQLPRVMDEAFISPSGMWYPCCLDANHDQAYGSVADNTLVELYYSRQRTAFIERLQAGEFSLIGYPCNRVPFCKGAK